ncbi:mrpl-15 [Pristionchus pacificus]|nr:mrpl-15 [Pristionchus pacificus]
MSSGRMIRRWSTSSARENAYKMIDETSRLNIHELKDNGGARVDGRFTRKATNQAGHTQGALERAAKPPLGWIWGDFFRPWHRMFPGERKYNSESRNLRPLVPISLIEIVRLVDLGYIDPTKLIDLPTLIGTRKLRLRDEVGVMLTCEGCSSLSLPLHLEVQATDEESIGAIEKGGGTIRVAYYDAISLKCAVDPIGWMKSGDPIPSRKMPPLSLFQSFSDPSKRGYLATGVEIEKERKKLASLMGYEYAGEQRIDNKGITQVFEGVPAGSIVNINSKKIFTPTHQRIKDYYEREISLMSNL